MPGAFVGLQATALKNELDVVTPKQAAPMMRPVPEGTVPPGWPPRPDRPIVGSLPTVAKGLAFVADRDRLFVRTRWLTEL